MVLQIGGEMFGRTVFGAENLTQEIEWPRDDAPKAPSELSKTDYEAITELLFKLTRDTLGVFVDSKIGVALSGGVDSSLILYLLKKQYPDADVTAYHSDWGYPPKSELEFAKMAAEFAGAPIKIVDVCTSKQIQFIDDALSKTKTISYSTVPVYMTFQEMANDGVDIAVNALGLDELFAGYTFHRKYFERSKLRVLPGIKTIAKMKYGPALARRYGTDKTWFLSHIAPLHSTPFVRDCELDIGRLYEEKIKATSMWNSIHNFLLDAMLHNFGNLIRRSGKASGLNVIYPFMHKEFMRKCLDLNPVVKVNKAPIRALMRETFGFPEVLAARGENLDKIGWGGTGDPYFQNKEYMDAIRPDKTLAKEWFTDRGMASINEFDSNPNVRKLKMALFLKTLELV
ncbi:MAG: asparagine synthase-related protein [Candidatus Thorarchaeota archaeon]